VKLVSFGPPGDERPGVLLDDGIAPLDDLAAVFAGRVEPGPERIDPEGVRLGPPVPRPQKVVVCGVNYPPPSGVPPRKPPLALRPPTSLAGPFDPIVLPPEAQELDYEAELGVVIGRGGRRIPRAGALAHVAGYLCAQDLTAWDVLRGDTDLDPSYLQITRAKSFDTFCPTGPWLVTADEVDPGALRIRCSVNGELRQDETTASMLQDVPALVEWVSSSMTLVPGDILLTGTPAGLGAFLDPPRYLRAGDVVRTEITGLGAMENPVVAEQEEPRG
jgi:2-keto-4-pentenoate hydratase/2-oxohepta-3-ene-1,7-dioic acid hydratase in catechol pathway